MTTLPKHNERKWTSPIQIVMLMLTLPLLTCTEPPNDEGRMILENDLTTLSSRLTHLNEVVEIDTTLAGGSLARRARAVNNPLNLVMVAEVEPPVIDGETLQATDVIIKSNYAYVSYNVSGEIFKGGVDIFDVRDKDEPELVSSLYFTDSDVNALAYASNDLYLAMATDRDAFSTPAVVERVRIRSNRLTDETTTWDMPSYAATDVEVTNNHLFVTTGADSGFVQVMKLNTEEIILSLPLEDARGVATDGRDVAVVAGTDARLLTFDYQSGELLNEFSLSGATIPFSKSTVQISNDKAILALGDGGTQIVCLDDGTVIEEIAPPLVADLDPSVTVTNAATTSKKVLFMANGEAGVYVAHADSRFSSKGCEVDDLEILGGIRFGDLQSVNHVSYVNNVLFVAGGLGGLKILVVSDDEDDDDDDDD